MDLAEQNLTNFKKNKKKQRDNRSWMEGLQSTDDLGIWHLIFYKDNHRSILICCLIGYIPILCVPKYLPMKKKSNGGLIE